ncbi:ABC transporter permease subunit [Paenibacillus frigoriresistens]|uniref:PhnE/PtxC family ABC transporter permease n=1 Tax=Paenibacillus alginolyticus TaxID=59839 RepID=UPI001562F2A1|nr:ABC transporter permease subunit [Paenibacillus frigoriresistens]NRF94598.1 ABC transporter permease subunit [Paenibacillus frigoriresistens]
MQGNFFAVKRRNSMMYGVLLLVLTLVAIIITEYNVVKGFTSIPKAIDWAISNFYPNEKAMKRLPDILDKLVETVLISIAATTVAAVFALIAAILGSNTTGVNGIFGYFSRGIATLFRNIDVAAWSMILLLSFGQSVLTGYFALFFGSFGFLTRAFMESIDEVSSSSVEALKATGAGYLSIICQSVIPASMPQFLSWILFMVETNIRHATLIGILTGTGIGFLFSLYYKSLNYSAASLIVIVIVLTILVIEYVSNYVRRVIL